MQNLVKWWIAYFIRIESHVIHLEIVSDLTPTTMKSNRATNFTLPKGSCESCKIGMTTALVTAFRGKEYSSGSHEWMRQCATLPSTVSIRCQSGRWEDSEFCQERRCTSGLISHDARIVQSGGKKEGVMSTDKMADFKTTFNNEKMRWYII